MWLIGMMASGKTKVGRVVAKKVGAPFFDTAPAGLGDILGKVMAKWRS